MRWRRLRGGSRGTGDTMAVLAVLAPEHTGLTSRAQPTFYWYVSKPAATRLALTLTDEDGIQPLMDLDLGAPKAAGVQALRLADHGIELKNGVTYEWFVALVPDPGQRASDVLASGAIQRVAVPQDLRRRLRGASPGAAARAYAGAGLRYDAVAALSEAISAEPGNPRPRAERAALMDQVGLPAVAAYDRAAQH